MGVGAGAASEGRLESPVLVLNIGAIRESAEEPEVNDHCSNVCWDRGPASVEVVLMCAGGVVNVISE